MKKMFSSSIAQQTPEKLKNEEEARSRVVERKTPTALISSSTDVDKFVLSFMIE